MKWKVLVVALASIVTACLSGCTAQVSSEPISIFNSDRSAKDVADCVYKQWKDGARDGGYAAGDVQYSTTAVGYVIRKPGGLEIPPKMPNESRLDYILRVESLLDDRSKTILNAYRNAPDQEETIAMVRDCHS